MNRFALVSALALTALGCTKANPDAVDAGGDPVEIDAGVELACTPNSSECADGIATVCDGDGNVAETTECTLGCFDAERCAKLDPSNGLAAHLDEAAEGEDVVLNEAITIDTTAGTVTDVNGTVDLDTELLLGGPVNVFVIRAKSIRTLDVHVVGDAALAIVADGSVTLDGVLDVSGRLGVSGPGAMTSEPACVGGAGESSEMYGVSGGGGGGYGAEGGLGGSTVPGLQFSNGGPKGSVSGNPEITPLRGGCDGGLAGRSAMVKGAAGGAVQIVSGADIEVSSTGGIVANGAGGGAREGGPPPVFCVGGQPCFGGAGGGSGGAILLEAPSVRIAAGATVVANGGGGGCGFVEFGADGGLDSSAASGANCESIQGGAGGAGDTPNGVDGTGNLNGVSSSSGGGGGGVGRIRVNVAVGDNFDPSGIVSPVNTRGILGTR